ncbi:MAG: hypothetical protein WD688_18340 [Candidatus Binatia bacterium]
MRTILAAAMIFALSVGLSACGKDDQSSAARDAEIQKKLQDAMQKEKQMYQGMQKGVETVEKQMQEQKEETKR